MPNSALNRTERKKPRQPVTSAFSNASRSLMTEFIEGTLISNQTVSLLAAVDRDATASVFPDNGVSLIF